MARLTMLCFCTVAFAAPPRPHIWLNVMDDLGFDDVGFRSHQIKTPNIVSAIQAHSLLRSNLSLT